jgi:uncharacterized protein
MNKDSLKQLLLDQRESIRKSLDSGDLIARKGLDHCRSFLSIPNVLLISGMRRVGKSVFSRMLAKDKRYAYAGFDDERLLGFKAEHFQLLLEALYEITPEPEYILFDEIQNIQGWELFINRLRPDHRIIVTGSNANLMSSEMATHLTGRFDVWQLFHMSFDEFLQFKKIPRPVSGAVSTTEKTVIANAFNEYLTSGGIFEGYLIGKEHLRTLFRAIVAKDIISRYKVAHPTAFDELAAFLINAAGNKISINRIAKRIGIKSSHTVKDYISYLETSFLLFTVNKFSYRIKEQQASFKKVYCGDNGILSAMSLDFSPDKGRFLENMIAIELKRRQAAGRGDFFYWDDYRRECDFVIKTGTRISSVLQVCYALNDSNTSRERDGLMAALEEFSLTEGLIITADQEDEIVSEEKRIKIVPAWKWLFW